MSVALLDTQALLWFLEGSERLSETARNTIAKPGAELFVSYASAWEITIKYGNGELALLAAPEVFLIDQLRRNRICCCRFQLLRSSTSDTCPRTTRIRSID